MGVINRQKLLKTASEAFGPLALSPPTFLSYSTTQCQVYLSFLHIPIISRNFNLIFHHYMYLASLNSTLGRITGLQ